MPRRGRGREDGGSGESGRRARGRRALDRGESDRPYGRRAYDDGRNPVQALRLAAFGFLGGLALGVVGWSQQVHQHRKGLFHASPLRRLAALGYLGGQPSVDTARLLRDYVGWERQSVLRRRGELVLRQMEQELE
jgi:hypothetical protein